MKLEEMNEAAAPKPAESGDTLDPSQHSGDRGREGVCGGGEKVKKQRTNTDTSVRFHLCSSYQHTNDNLRGLLCHLKAQNLFTTKRKLGCYVLKKFDNNIK